MNYVADFHSSGSEDGDEIVYHNQADCATGKELKKNGTAVPGKGYYRTLCRECKVLIEGSPGVDPF